MREETPRPFFLDAVDEDRIAQTADHMRPGRPQRERAGRAAAFDAQAWFGGQADGVLQNRAQRHLQVKMIAFVTGQAMLDRRQVVQAGIGQAVQNRLRQ